LTVVHRGQTARASSIPTANERLRRLTEICKAFPKLSYAGIDNNRLAVYAIALLEEHGIPRTQEAITVSLFLMFPEKFSLAGFPEYPEGERVTRTLLQLGKKYRNWADGNKHVGFTLTSTGRSVLQQTKQLLASPQLQLPVNQRTPKEMTRDPLKEISEIEATQIHQAYKQNKIESLDEFAVWELLQAFPNTPVRALRERLRAMREAAQLGGRDDIVKFLDWVAKQYRETFEDDK